MARRKIIQLGEVHATTDKINTYKYTKIKRIGKGKESDDFSKKNLLDILLSSEQRPTGTLQII